MLYISLRYSSSCLMYFEIFPAFSHEAIVHILREEGRRISMRLEEDRIALLNCNTKSSEDKS